MARLVVFVAAAIASVISIGVILVVLGANPDNSLVQLVTGLAETLVGPFRRLFTFDSPGLQTAINWGIAAVVWLVLGHVLAGLVSWLSSGAHDRSADV